MNDKATFLLTMSLTAVVFAAGSFVNADKNGNDQRPLAESTGKATIEECEITGKLIRREDGVYAVFCADNETDVEKTLEYNFKVTCTPAMSMISRMMPMPLDIKKGCVAITAKAGKRTEHEVLVQKAPELTDETAAAAGNKPKVALPLQTPEIWMLVVSTGEVPAAPAGGLAPIVTASGKSVAGKGTFVLARTTPKPVKTT